MSFLDTLRHEATKLKDKKLMPPPPPPDNKRKREGGDDANQMSQRIEKLGLRTASYYKTLTLTEGILRKRLTLIHNLIEARCKEGDRDMRVLLPEIVLDDSVRAALDIQHIKVDDTLQPADCACGETPCEGEPSGCILPGYYISWKGED